jgi:hypothetical protein
VDHGANLEERGQNALVIFSEGRVWVSSSRVESSLPLNGGEAGKALTSSSCPTKLADSLKSPIVLRLTRLEMSISDEV